MITPFLTILTRHHKRPWMLERCRASVLAQTCDDYEHVILHDHVGLGIRGSHQMAIDHAGHYRGRYIWMLDDDDWLIEPGFVDAIKRTAEAHNDPPVIVVRANHPSGLLPSDEHWHRAPELGHIGMPCVVVRADVWRQWAHRMLDRERGCDYAFISAMYGAGVEFVRLDLVAVQVGQIGAGRMEQRYAHCAGTLKRIPNLWRPGRLLYVGASALNVPAFAYELRQAGHEITLLEIWPENVRYYEAQGGTSFAHVVHGDVRQLDDIELPYEYEHEEADNWQFPTYDVAFWWHGPEHVARDEVAPTLKLLEREADLVVVACPFGVREQEPGLANPYQDHQCALYPDDFRALGYQTQTIGERDHHGQLIGWKGDTGMAEKTNEGTDELDRNERGEPQYVKLPGNRTYWCLLKGGRRFVVRDMPHLYELGLGPIRTIAQEEMDGIELVEEPCASS